MTIPIRPPQFAASAWSEFRAFLIKQNALALAIGVVIGAALNGVVKSLVDGIIMPFVGLISPAESYAEWKWTAGGAEFLPGLVIAAIINFLIIGLVAWRLTKLLIKPEVPGPSAATRPCPHCYTTIDARATRCQNCTGELTPSAAA